MNVQQNLKRLTKDNTRYYSEQAVVIQTYRVKDQQELFNQGKLGSIYDPYLHLVCTVRLVKDGSILYAVKLTPHILSVDGTGNVTEKIIDGSTDVDLKVISQTNVRIDVPRIGSYVFISWLDEEDAYVSFQSESESIVVGNPNGAYIDLYSKDETRIIDLVNCDEFKVQFPNGRIFNIKTDVNTNLSELIVKMNSILLQAENSKIDIKENVDIIVSNSGKITISNNTESLKVILNDIISELISYFNTIEPTLVIAGLTSLPTVNKLTQVNTQVNSLFQ